MIQKDKLFFCEKNILLLYFFSISLLFFSCTKEKDYIYEVNNVNITQDGADKTKAKTTVEFISIAYTDLFAAAISQSDLNKLNTVYTAFGDKKLIEDRIIRNFLNNPNIQIPSSVSNAGDTASFIADTYRKFYNREPNAFESYYVKEQIRLNASVKPLTIYYALMTSDEYRFY